MPENRQRSGPPPYYNHRPPVGGGSSSNSPLPDARFVEVRNGALNTRREQARRPDNLTKRAAYFTSALLLVSGLYLGINAASHLVVSNDTQPPQAQVRVEPNFSPDPVPPSTDAQFSGQEIVDTVQDVTSSVVDGVGEIMFNVIPPSLVGVIDHSLQVVGDTIMEGPEVALNNLTADVQPLDIRPAHWIGLVGGYFLAASAGGGWGKFWKRYPFAAYRAFLAGETLERMGWIPQISDALLVMASLALVGEVMRWRRDTRQHEKNVSKIDVWGIKLIHAGLDFGVSSLDLFNLVYLWAKPAVKFLGKSVKKLGRKAVSKVKGK